MKKSIFFVSIAILATMFSCKPKDTKGPEIYLEGGKSVTVILNKPYEEKGFTAYDNVDGDVTNKVEVTTDIPTDGGTIYGNTSLKGDYTVTYKVADKEGNSGSATRSVKVINQASKYAIPYFVDKVSMLNPEISEDYTHKEFEVTDDKKINNRIIFGKLANLVNGIYGDVYYNSTHDTIFIKIETQSKKGNDTTQFEISGYDKSCYFTDTLNYTFQIKYDIDAYDIDQNGDVSSTRRATDEIIETYTKQ